MKKRKWIFLSFTLFTFSLSSCDPSRFVMQGFHKVDCRILSPYGSVDGSNYYYDLYPTGCVKMTVPEKMQNSIELWVNLTHGEGVKMMLRSRTEETVLDSGYVLTLSRNGVHVDSSGMQISSQPSAILAENKPSLVTIYNDERFTQVTLGCDTIFRRMTSTKAPDDIVFASIDSSTVRIYAVDWRELKYGK